MINPVKTFSLELGGRTLTISVGQLANQASGSCTVQYGDTMALCTATMGEAREDAGFFPLSVDFEERMYASGKIKGSRFIKREGRPTDEAILSGRLIDRAIRPLFPDGMKNEIAVVTTVFSHDQENDADVPGLIGSACALAISDIPWHGPIAAVRVGRKDGKLIIMPSYADIDAGGLDLVVAGTGEKIIMLESGAARLPEEEMLAAMKFGMEQLNPIIELINKVVAAVGKAKADPMKAKDEEDAAKRAEVQALYDQANAFLDTQKSVLFAEPLKSKADRKAAIGRLKKTLDAHLKEKSVSKDNRKKSMDVLEDFVDTEVTNMILNEKRRADGRALDEIRDLSAIVGLVPRTHGSGLFQRGQTQVLSTVTLGSPGMEQTIDTMEFQTTRRYFHHYNFPSYSVGETRANRGPGRREIGHGALAERALLSVLPDKETFPYTIRVVSEVLGSNGSSSMGSTCGSTLALLDAGVPILEPVAGIAMGVASDEKNNKWQIITDLQDLEDGTGGMDFKVAGTKTGITAIQMDTKTAGIPWHVIEETVKQAKVARMKVLAVMEATIAATRPELSKWAPRIVSFHINPELIRNVIGPGGKIINEIIATHKVQIDIEDSGLVMVTSVTPDSLQKAVDWIKQLTHEVKAGEKFEGPVTRLMDFGAFVEIMPKTEGLVHISELAPWRVGKVEDIVQIGQMVKVIVKEIDSMGRVNLSMKAAEGNVYPEKPPESDTPPFRGGAGGGGARSGGFGGSRGGDRHGSSRPPRRDDRPFPPKRIEPAPMP